MKRKTRNNLKICISIFAALVLIALVSSAIALDDSKNIINDMARFMDWIFIKKY